MADGVPRPTVLLATRRGPSIVVGALVGAAAGLLIALLLFLLAIAPPGQTVVFGLMGTGIIGGAWLCAFGSQRWTRAVVLGGGASCLVIGLIGIPALSDTGAAIGQCAPLAGVTADHLYQGDRTPESTSAAHPWTIDRHGVLDWEISAPFRTTEHQVTLAADVGGIALPVWAGAVTTTTPQTRWYGTIDVGDALNQARYATGIAVSGTVHVMATFTGSAGTCTIDAYVRVPPEGPFTGPALQWTWTLLAVAGVALAHESRRDRVKPMST